MKNEINSCKCHIQCSDTMHVNVRLQCCTGGWQGRGLAGGAQITPKTREPGGSELLPCGQDDLRAVWRLKHKCGLRSVSPISSHTLLWPTGRPVTKTNQHLKETNSEATPGTQASEWLRSMIISSAKQTSHYVKTTLACEKRLGRTVLG